MTSYNNRRNTNSKVLKTFKDYLFPIIAVGIILILIVNYLFSGSDTAQKTVNNSLLEVSLGTPDTESYIVFNGGKKTKLEAKSQMSKTEKLQVVNGSLNIKDINNELTLNKLGELRYNEDGGYTLYSSDLWVNSSSGINIEMRYAKVSTTNKSVFSLSQNEVASTIYVVSGIVDVKNLAGKTASLQKGEKLVIMRNNANDENSDLALSKEQIDDYVKSDDWFIKNNGSSYLSSADLITTNSGSLSNSGNTNSGAIDINSTGSISSGETTSYISFNSLYNEAEINTNSIDIEGKILSDMVFKIEINGKLASVDTSSKTFILKGFKLSGKTNDIVYKVYDEGSKLLYIGAMVVYGTNGSITTSSNNSNSTLAQVENYPITSSPLYQILAPKQNPYTTSEDVVRIEGNVPAGTIEKIIVNDFELKKFPKFGSYWSYFANSDFGNLKEGLNIYKIQYFGAEGKLIYENNFTIIKEVKKVEAATGSISVTGTTSVTETASGITE